MTYDFPPMGGGIARWMDAIARCHPPGALVVSTGRYAGADGVDASFPGPVDRVNVAANRLRNVPGLVRWSHRAADLARNPAMRFGWCGNVRPAIYPAAYAKWRTSLPYGIIVHGGDLLTLQSRLESVPRRRMMRHMLAGASAFVANSRWTGDLCAALLAELAVRRPVTVIPLGTDPDRYRPDAALAAGFQARRSLPGARWLLTVARLVPHKGIDVALRAFARIAPRFPDLRYAIVGRGPDEARLRSLVAELDLGGRVHLLVDVGDDELPGVYAMAAIYIGLSRATGVEVEGFGIALLEAAAAGLPVVAGASGGTADAVEDGETGVLVDPADDGGAAGVLSRLLEHPEVAQALGAAGRRRVTRHFTWTRVVADMQAIAKEYGRS